MASRKFFPISWMKWRRRRYWELVSEGVSGTSALKFATAEARKRSLLTHHIGRKAAEAANLVSYERDGETHFALAGDLSALTEAQRNKLSALVN